MTKETNLKGPPASEITDMEQWMASCHEALLGSDVYCINIRDSVLFMGTDMVFDYLTLTIGCISQSGCDNADTKFLISEEIDGKEYESTITPKSSVFVFFGFTRTLKKLRRGLCVAPKNY